MKIVHAVPTYLPVIGGAEINVSYLARESLSLGIKPTILTFNMTKRWDPNPRHVDEDNNGIHIIRCSGIRPYPNVRYLRSLLPLVLGARILPLNNVRKIFRAADVIHFHDEVDLSLPIAALGINVPKVMHIRTIGFLIDGFKKCKLRRKILSKIATVFICNSSTSADCLTTLGIEKSRIKVIPNGVDPHIFSYPEKQHRNNKQLLFVGRMQKEKGLHVLLKAMEGIKTPLELIIIVGGITDQNYYDEQKKNAKSLTNKIGHKVTWKYAVTHDQLAEHYKKASIFVCPSFNEPFGNVNIEAMACGVPVIASRSGGPLDIFTDGKDGLLFDNGDSKQLTDAIKQLLSTESLRKELTNNALKKIKDTYIWEKVSFQVYQTYKLLLQNSLEDSKIF